MDPTKKLKLKFYYICGESLVLLSLVSTSVLNLALSNLTTMVRGSYCQQVMTFFFLVFDLLKLQFQSGTPLLKSLDLPLVLLSKGLCSATKRFGSLCNKGGELEQTKEQ